MRAILASFLGGFRMLSGVREPYAFKSENKLLHNIKSNWKQNSKVLIIHADPDNFKKNDSICACFKESFPMSGLSIEGVHNCDNRNPHITDELGLFDAIVLCGGHVPTQSRFLKNLRLREKVQDYKGLVLASSAGSMNCAATVYAGPERDGEATDPSYERWISGLGITDINIFPHFQRLHDEYLDGMRLIEDITYSDSIGHELLALHDGSYIFIDGERTILYGEAYLIKDATVKQICKNGESVVLH